MANQKSYSIVINGVKESISEIDILLNKLNAIEKKINELGKDGIKIDTKGLKELEKIKIPEISIEGIETKSLQKEMKQLEKDIAKGAKTIDGEYTNTLNGLRAQLRDLKAELGKLDLDIDADAFEDLTADIKELNDKVKEMEQDYGTFSRNVGNYTDSMVDALNEFDGQVYETVEGIKEVKQGVDSLKGKQMFDVNIGGVAIQFENVSQAIGEIDDMAHSAAAKMQQLAAAGKQNTDEYKKLNAEFQEFVQASAQLERVRKQTDALRDSVASTTRGLDVAVQGFQALGNVMQIGSGIAGLFGDNQEKIAEAINRTVQIQAVLQAATELYNQTIQKGTVLNSIYSATFGKINTGIDKMVVGLGKSTKAAKGLGTVAKGGIWAVVISAIASVAFNLDSVTKKFKESEGATKLWKLSIEKIMPVIKGFGEAIQSFLIYPLIGWLDGLAKIIDGDFKGAIDEIKKGYKNAIDFKKNYERGYNEEVTKLSEERTKKEKLELDKQLLHQKEYNEAKYGSDWQYTKEGIELYRKYFANKLSMYGKDTEEYRQALLEQLRYERELKEYQDRQAKEKNGKKGGSSGKSEADKQKEIQRAIARNEIAAMKEGFAKKMAELKRQEKEELEDAEKNEKLLTSIKAKYQKERERLLEQHNEEVKRLNDSINDTMLLGSYDDSINYLTEWLTEAYRNIDKVNDELSVFSKEWKKITDVDGRSNSEKGFDVLGDDFGTKDVSKFQKFIFKLKDKWNDFVSQLKGEDLESKISKSISDLDKLKSKIFGGEKIDEDVTNTLTSLYVQSWDNTIKQLKEKYGDISKLNESQLKSYEEELAKTSEYYESKLKLVKDYNSKEVGLILIAQQREMMILNNETLKKKQQEKNHYDELTDQLTKQYEKEIENTELKETEKSEIKKRYDMLFEQAEKQHKQRLLNIDMEASNKAITIEENSLRERSNLVTRYNDIIFNQYSKTYEDIERLREGFSNVDNVDLGSQDLSKIGNFSASIMETSRFSGAFKKMADDIKKQKEELVKQFQDGVITEEAFNKSYGELSLLEEQVNFTLKGLTKSWQEWTASSVELASAVVNIWSQMYSQIADLQYQNEMYRIEKLREEYDKETDILKDKLEEQQELYQKYNESVQSIEDELQTARGDRRLFLLDQINEEMMKREQAWAQEQKIQKQQEQLEKKKEALEQRQKAAEQKRNKQNQKVQIAQGLANTALAVTNALAVQPFFLGVALAAVAAAMGAVQVATIAKQKFADGGVIQGKSHSQGGVKVLGGQAEVEGGEYITNKVTTSKNVDVLTFINSKKKKLDLNDFIEFYSSGSKSYSKSPKFKYADGGQLPSMQAPQLNVRDIANANNMDNRPIYVSVTEIENVQNRVRNVRAIAGMED